MTVEDLRRDRWDAASYRCPCGFAGDDVGEFERHLDAADGAGPEHFEVLEGWTFEQVRLWQAAAGAPGKPGAAPVARWLLPLGPAPARTGKPAGGRFGHGGDSQVLGQ
jgi:hypothetical protein